MSDERKKIEDQQILVMLIVDKFEIFVNDLHP